MTAVVFYFQVHQPYRLRPYKRSLVGKQHDYFDDRENARLVQRVAERCYIPMNKLLAEAIEETDGQFRCSFSLSGTAIQQMRDWVPEALDSFVDLAETGNVEFLCETSQHSLASQRDMEEFEAQVLGHRAVIEDLFGKRPTTFRNTELVIDEAIGRRVEQLGFDTLLGEGADRLLGYHSPQYVYGLKGCPKLKLLLRSYVFSDDIAFRFSNPDWPQNPLFADTFAGWLHNVPEHAQFIGLFMDYETFGEHQWESTGILEFMRYLPGFILENDRFSFCTPAEVAAAHEPLADLNIPDPVSWADQERDLTAWLGNPMQDDAHRALYELRPLVYRAAERGHEELLADWRKLTTSDHVYYMCTKFFSDGDVHKYFTPYESPHEAFVRFMSALDDLRARLRNAEAAPKAATLPAKSRKKPGKMARSKSGGGAKKRSPVKAENTAARRKRS